MPGPLSDDLRTRIVEAYFNEEGSFPTLAARFSVGEGSVKRYVALFRATGSVSPKPSSGGPAPKVDEEGDRWIRGFVAQNNDATDQEIADAFATHFLITVGHATINRALHRLGITRKKNQLSRQSKTVQMLPLPEKNSKKTKKS